MQPKFQYVSTLLQIEWKKNIYAPKIIRIITNTTPRDLWGSFQEYGNNDIRFLVYIYSLVLYSINNKDLFDTNNEIHKYKTRNNNNFHCPVANLSKFSTGAYMYSTSYLCDLYVYA